MALALTRRVGESIILYRDNKEIGRFKIVSTGKQNPPQVLIGFDFPADVTIMRAEVVEKKG